MELMYKLRDINNYNLYHKEMWNWLAENPNADKHDWFLKYWKDGDLPECLCFGCEMHNGISCNGCDFSDGCSELYSKYLRYRYYYRCSNQDCLITKYFGDKIEEICTEIANIKWRFEE